MADVKWIKITTDIFDDEKILLIEALPEADSIIVIWFKLLTFAGKQNNDGVFTMSNRIAYTEEMLATIFRRPINTVRLALKTFRDFGMIEIIDNVITIPNWDKHQSLDKLEKTKEQTRIRVARHREKQKQLLQCNDYSNADVTQCNAIDKNREDKELDIDKDINNTKSKKQKHKHGEYSNVLLTEDEYNKLYQEYSNAKELIKYLDEYIEMKGYKAKSHYLAIKKWVVDAVNEKKAKSSKGAYTLNNGVETSNPYIAMLERMENED